MAVLLRYLILPLLAFCITGALFVMAAKRYPVYVFSSTAVLIAIGLIQGQRKIKRDQARGWRVGHANRDSLYYEELRDGTWHHVEIGGEFLVGTKTQRVIYVDGPKFPEWAKERRDEIISRIKSEFHPPKYAYDEAGQ